MRSGKDPCSLHEFQSERLTELAIEDASFEWSPSDPMIRAHITVMKEGCDPQVTEDFKKTSTSEMLPP